jgi:hypothetical protein
MARRHRGVFDRFDARSCDRVEALVPQTVTFTKRDLRTNSPTARGTPLLSKGGESEVRYPAAGEYEASRPRPELLERCFLPTSATTHLQHENPKIVRFTSARLSRTDPGHVPRTLQRANGEDATRAPTRPSPCRSTMRAREPRVEPRLTTRFQLRLARHRSEFFARKRAAPERCASSRLCRPRTRLHEHSR